MVRVTVKNEEIREGVILVKHEGEGVRQVQELDPQQATTFNLTAGQTIEIIERTKSLTEIEGGSPPAADGGEKAPAA
jgi:hypothetical protein